MHKFLLFVWLMGAIPTLLAQNKRMDSLLVVLERVENAQKISILNELAWEFREKKPETSLLYAQQALKLSEQYQDVQGKASALNCIGVVYGKSRKYKEAIKHYEQSLELRKNLDDTSAIANTLYNLAITYEKQNNYPKAIDYYEALISIYEKNKQLKEKFEVLYALGGIWFAQMRNADKSLYYFEKALETAQQYKNLNAIYRSYKGLRTVYYAQPNQQEKGIYYHLKSLETIQQQINQAPNKILQRSYQHFYFQDLMALSYSYIRQKNSSKVEEICEEALKLNEATYPKNSSQYLVFTKNVADTYKQAGLNQKAIKLYEKIVNITPIGSSNILFWPSQLLEVAIQMKEYPTALKYSKESINEEFDFSYTFEEKRYYLISKPEQLVEDVRNIHIGLEGQDSLRNKYFNQNFKAVSERFDEVANYVRDLAYIYKFTGEQAQSEIYYQKYIRIYQNLIEYLEDKLPQFINENLVNERINQAKKIIRNIEGELVFFDKIDAEKRLQESIAQRLKAEKKIKEEESAFLMQKNILSEDARKKEKEKRQALELAHQEETEKNKVLSQKNRLLTLNKTLNERISYALGMILFLMIALALLMYRAGKKQKKANEKLMMQNEEILQKTEEIQAQRDEIESQRDEIEIERKKSDTLLLNILPEEVAQELKEKGMATPRYYEKVTVLFTDFKNFTQLAERLTPQEVIEQLNVCFLAFDEICERNHLEKIKTIGDAFMAAGGLPIENETNPLDAVKAGLEMQEWVANWQRERAKISTEVWELRIGIHTGSVVAGVIGKNKFAYDIWGDAVNTAARMESSGEPNRVNISGTTYELIKDHYHCTYRGKISAKNKGDVDMYFVELRK